MTTTEDDTDATETSKSTDRDGEEDPDGAGGVDAEEDYVYTDLMADPTSFSVSFICFHEYQSAPCHSLSCNTSDCVKRNMHVTCTCDV